MFRIRFHGRGGQGMKTAGRMLGTAFFLAGFEVQDAPRYGAERRGAPIFAYVRADRRPINERGVIRQPDLVAVADDTLVGIPAADVLAGAAEHTVFLLHSGTPAEVWQERLRVAGPILVLPDTAKPAAAQSGRFIGAALAGAASRLVGVIPRDRLDAAIRQELAALGEEAARRNVDLALAAYDALAGHAGCVRELPPAPMDAALRPLWLDLEGGDAGLAAPAIFAAATSLRVPTGLWRTVRPVIDYDRCKRCAWICSTLCPDGVISLNQEGYPVIDYEHCKGCLICLANCPTQVIRAVPEEEVA
jgi:pyruvate ferredoxin oxidoreductase gamma subunit